MKHDDDGKPSYPLTTSSSLFPLAHGAGLFGSIERNLPAVTSHASSGVAAWVPLTMELGGREITVGISPADKPLIKQRLKELIRKEKRRAANAGNAANTAQQIGVGIGGALAVGGGIAVVTVAAPLLLGAAVLTGAGTVVAIVGLSAAHWFNGKKFERDEQVDRYTDALEELK